MEMTVSQKGGTDPPELETLVQLTTGLQPWRRAFHAANGVAIASVLWWWPHARTTAVALLAGGVVLLGLADLVRLKRPALNRAFFRWFRQLASPREAEKIASSTWYLLGITLAVAIAPGPAAVSGILVLALADPAASYFGRRWGRRAFLGGSLEGSLLFCAVTLAVLLPRHSWPIALATALPVTLVERRSWPLDDNLTVPVTCALVVNGLEQWI